MTPDEPMTNVAYTTDEISRYFAQNRISWTQFYPSERAVIGQLGLGAGQSVLDIGCGCGGLGLAVRDEFQVTQYTGVEINPQAASLARTMNVGAEIHGGDILDLAQCELLDRQFDVVFSLSCVDWNVQFADMFAVAWNYVRPGGYFVVTLRLTAEDGCSDPARSHQFINYDGKREGELASYVVVNALELGTQILSLEPSEVIANGYWRAPSPSAVTPYEELCFAAFALKKRVAGSNEAPHYVLDLPRDIGELVEHPTK